MARVLLQVPTVENAMIPLIAAVRVDTQWHSRSPLVHCLARLTRQLSLREREEMRRYPEFALVEDGVTYTCRPEEAEASQKRLAGALVSAAAAALEPRTLRRLLRRPGARARAR